MENPFGMTLSAVGIMKFLVDSIILVNEFELSFSVKYFVSKFSNNITHSV